MFGFDEEEPVLLVWGGSQGAEKINEYGMFLHDDFFYTFGSYSVIFSFFVTFSTILSVIFMTIFYRRHIIKAQGYIVESNMIFILKTFPSSRRSNAFV